MSVVPAKLPSARPATRRGVKLAERLSQEIVEDITRLGLQPGARLPSEVAMAQERGVSRTSLREALRILEVHGLINVRTGPGGGPEVANMGVRDFTRMATLHFHVAGVTFRQLLDARLVLEPQMARLAAEKRTPEQLSALDDVLELHGTAKTTEDLAYCSHTFHSIVAEMAGNGNQVLSIMTSSLHSLFEVYAKMDPTRESMVEMTKVHEKIADAIREGAPDSAAKYMERHMIASAKTFEKEHPTLVNSTVSWLSA